MKYKIYSDLHWGQTSEIMTDVEPSNGDIFLGDIFDIKNTSKKKINSQLAKQVIFRRKCNVVGAKYVIGNHDLIIDPMNNTQFQHIIGNVLFTHGHLELWSDAKIKEWELKEPKGVGFFRRMQLEVQNLISRGVWEPSLQDIKRLEQITRMNGCDTICIGHTHTAKLVDFISNGIRIVNVPRGLTEIEL